MEFLKIFYPLLFTGQYDFNIWYGIAKERSGIWWEWLYRIPKEIIDLAVIPGILHYCYGWSFDLIGAYYIMKLFAWSDAVYIAIAKLFTLGQPYIDGPIWWMWWTPLGLIRTIVFLLKHGSFKKGELTRAEFYMQLLLGVVAAYLLYNFKLVSLFL